MKNTKNNNLMQEPLASSEESFLPNLIKEIANMLKSLEKNKIYSILPFVVNNENQKGNVVVEHAIFIPF